MQPLNLDTELNLRDRVSGSLEKDSFIALASKGDYSGLIPSKLCLNLEAVVRSFIVMVQRGGCDHLMDILLIGWWGGNSESASSTFLSQCI